MRIAICLSGNMRTFRLTANRLYQNVVDPNNADIFIATWDVVGTGKHNTSGSELFREPLEADAVRETYPRNLRALSIYSFASDQPPPVDGFFQGMVSMFWLVKCADRLRTDFEKEHGFVYDAVIRCRPDMDIHTPFAIETPADLRDVLWVTALNPAYIPDTFAIANARTMNTYASLYDSLGQYVPIIRTLKPPPGESVIFTPEQTLKYHLDSHGIAIGVLPISVSLNRGGHSYG